MPLSEFSNENNIDNATLLEFKDLETKIELGFEMLNETEQEEIFALLEIIVKTYPYFFEATLLLFNAYTVVGNRENAIEILNKGYENILSLILDDKGNWPKKMTWEINSNRPIYNVLIEKANEFWSNGRLGQAYNIYMNVLKLDLRDHSYNRYAFLAILQGMSFKKYLTMWLRCGSETKNLSAWFEKYAPDHCELKFWIKTL